jgi:hypothetical protein
MPNSKEAPQNSHRFSPQLSVIIPVYNEAGNLPQLIKELGEVLFFQETSGISMHCWPDWQTEPVRL